MRAQRITLLLAVLVILVMVGGLLGLRKMRATHTNLSRENKKLQTRVQETSETAKMLDKIKDQYDELSFRWQSAPKKILNLEEPALTVSYLVWTIENYKLDLDFDFALDKMSRASNIANFSFILTGDAKYESLYDFVFYLTMNPLLYTITNIELRRWEEDPERIEFILKMTGYFMKADPNNQTTERFEFASIHPPNRDKVFFDIFASRLPAPKKQAVAKTVTKDPSLLDVDKASLVALTSQKAYFLDDNAKMFKLSPGDRVNGGKFVRLDLNNSQAVFVMHESSGKQVILGLDTR